MNAGEKVAALYLRLNGFLILTEFTTFGVGAKKSRHTHVDIMGLRAKGSRETLAEHDQAFHVAPKLFAALAELLECRSAKNKHIGIIAEVKAGAGSREVPSMQNTKYVERFLGGIPPVRIAFRDWTRIEVEIAEEGGRNYLKIGLRHAYRFICTRIHKMDDFAKLEGWSWSEESLSDILYFEKLRRGNCER